jgi:hypothetical protein
MNTNSVILAFDPTKFFWSSADSNDFSLNSCELQQCTLSELSETNIQDCYSKELCNNKTNAELLSNMQTLHSGADGRFSDTSNIYKYTMLDTFNLSVGIVIMISITSKFFYQK